mgnify:CR=1 FL=1
MKEEHNTPMDNNQEEININYQILLQKCLIHWRWFLTSILICLALAFIYIRYTIPMYKISASMLVQEESKKGALGGLSGGALSMLQGVGGFSLSTNFDNELEIMQSRTLLKKVVTDLGLYISTFQRRLSGYNIPLYKTSPIQTYLSPEDATKLEEEVKIKITYTPEGKLYAQIKLSLIHI